MQQPLRPILTALFLTLALGPISSVPGTAAGERGETLLRIRARLDAAEADFVAGRHEEARERFSELVHEATALGDPNLALARAVDRLGDLERLRGNPELAAPLYVRSSRMWEELLGENQPRLATTLHNLGTVWMAQGRSDRAIPPLRRALAIWDGSFGPSSAQARNTRRALEQCADGL